MRVVNVLKVLTALLVLQQPLGVLAANIKDNDVYLNCLANVASCTTLYLHNVGGLTGTIPTEVGLMVNIDKFYLQGNSFVGTLPTEVGMLSLVDVFAVGNNDLTGLIPTEIGQIAALKWLELHQNEFSGALPTELSLLTGMTTLNICCNPGICGTDETKPSVGNVGTEYVAGSGGTTTSWGSPCPSSAPTVYTAPTPSPASLPCCDTLRANPIFCCMEARNPAFALSVCNDEC